MGGVLLLDEGLRTGISMDHPPIREWVVFRTENYERKSPRNKATLHHYHQGNIHAALLASDAPCHPWGGCREGVATETLALMGDLSHTAPANLSGDWACDANFSGRRSLTPGR